VGASFSIPTSNAEPEKPRLLPMSVCIDQVPLTKAMPLTGSTPLLRTPD
jgi:hypothetical protein